MWRNIMNIRDKFKIPDTYQKDTHLSNWLRKHMMPTLSTCFIQDKLYRGTITKSGTNISHTEVICCFEDNTSVKLSINEDLFMEKRV